MYGLGALPLGTHPLGEPMFRKTVAVTDTPTAVITDTSAVQAGIAVTDNPTYASTAVVAVTAGLPRSDTPTVVVGDASSSLSALSRSDTPTVVITDASALQAGLAVADTIPGGAPTVGTLLFADTFNRADGAVGNGWTGDWTIASNQLVPGTARLWRDVGAADMVAEATFVTLPTTAQELGLLVRFSAGSGVNLGHYVTVDNAGTARLYIDGGNAVRNLGAAIHAGDSVRLYAYGTTVEVWVNGVQVWSEPGVTNDYGTRAGFQYASAANGAFDSFNAYSAATLAAPPLLSGDSGSVSASTPVTDVAGTDAPAAAITDTSSSLVSSAVSDTPTVVVTDTRTLDASSTVTDDLAVAVDDASALLAALSAADTPSVAIVDAGAVAGALAVADTPSVAVTEGRTLDVTLARTDDLIVGLLEVVTSAVSSAVSDELDVGVDDAGASQELALEKDGTDALLVAIADAVALAVAQGVSDEQVLHLADVAHVLATGGVSLDVGRFTVLVDTGHRLAVLVDRGARSTALADTGNRGSRYEDPGLRATELVDTAGRSDDLEDTGRTVTAAT